MNLRDGTSKMSKSDNSEYSKINMIDTPEEIHAKVKRAKTDSISGISYDPTRPEIANLLSIFAAFTSKQETQIAEQFKKNHQQILLRKH